MQNNSYYWTSMPPISQHDSYYWTSMARISQYNSYSWTSMSYGCLNLYFWVYRVPAGRWRRGGAATAAASQQLSPFGRAPGPSRPGTKYPVQGIPHFDQVRLDMLCKQHLFDIVIHVLSTYKLRSRPFNSSTASR